MHMVRLDSLADTYHFDPFKKFFHKKDMPEFSQFCIYFSMHNIEHCKEISFSPSIYLDEFLFIYSKASLYALNVSLKTLA